jgi:6-pyruvoyltetrahydropterin/6-carboxytetrahydropterin synthase
MMELTRRYRFAASHRLHAVSLSEERNREIYGKCNNPYGHGHDYVLEVRVRGRVDEETGMVVDVRRLDALVGRAVLADFHMKNLNAQVPEFGEQPPTSENVTREIERRLCGRWREEFPSNQPALDGIRLIETRKNVFESNRRGA